MGIKFNIDIFPWRVHVHKYTVEWLKPIGKFALPGYDNGCKLIVGFVIKSG